MPKNAGCEMRSVWIMVNDGTVISTGPPMPEVRVGQVWEQVAKHERGMRLEVVRATGQRWVLRPVGGGPSKKRGLREGLWTLSAEQLNATCRLVRAVD